MQDRELDRHSGGRTPWSLAASGGLYEIPYGRRGRAEARRQWAYLRRQPEFGGLVQGARVVDLGAGRGRLTAVLSADGLRVVAIERSESALLVARRRAVSGLVRADLDHLPLAHGSMAGAVALFSSLGHDLRPAIGGLAAHLATIARCLAPGAPLAADLPDPAAVDRGLVPASERWVGGLRLQERRRISRDPNGAPRSVHKRVEIRRGRFVAARWHEHLSLWTPDEVLEAARRARLAAPRALHGDRLEDFGPGRLLLLARAAGQSGTGGPPALP